MAEITLSTSVLADLLDYLPNPDDAGPVGPAGPVIRWLDWVMLNPQPLPPREIVFGPRPEPWGPGPIPWRWAALARATISTHLERLEMAGIIIVSGDTERAVRSSSESLNQFVDEICGTPPYKGPFPRPWGPFLDTETLHPINLISVGAQFQRAADALGNSPLHDALEQAALRALSAGLERLTG